MEYKINRENGITNRGNLTRLKKLMKRAQKGETITLGFLGGSITQGSLASQPNLCYAYRVYSWWCKTFPQSKFVYINAGIGGTNSQFGVARVEDDLLSSHPDFVITEFSVNDLSTEHFCETYEGVVRRICLADGEPAVLLVHNVYYDSGSNAQVQHAKIGRHYQLPCVSMQSTIYPEILSGQIENRMITEDDLHPNDLGHELVASVITYFLEKVLAEVDQSEQPEQNFPRPLTLNTYEKSVRYQNYNCKPRMDGFISDQEPQGNITDIFKRGWYASDKGDKIKFTIEATGISVQYRKAVNCGAPVARIVIDGDESKARLLDGNFPGGWGNMLELETITEHGPLREHIVEIEIVEEAEEKKNAFYLVSLLATK